MTKKKALEPSAFAASSGGAAAVPAKASSLKMKTSRPRKAASKMEIPVLPPLSEQVALSSEVPIESTTRTSNPETPRAKSTAVTHRHKKLESASADLRAETEPARPALQAQPAEPSQREIAELAYSYYVARGFEPGNPTEDWFRATAELRARLNP